MTTSRMTGALACAAIASGTLIVAPTARADTTMTAAEICSQAAPGTALKLDPFSQRAVCSNALVPGLFMTSPAAVASWMDRNFVGSYPIDPNNPFSDWVVPAGAGKKPQDNSFRWKSDLDEEWKVCPPTCPSY